MAMCDYRCCDICGSKAFYDANLNYTDEPLIEGQVKIGYHYLDNLGGWAVICSKCSKTHQCIVVEQHQPEAEGEGGEGE